MFESIEGLKDLKSPQKELVEDSLRTFIEEAKKLMFVSRDVPCEEILRSSFISKVIYEFDITPSCSADFDEMV